MSKKIGFWAVFSIVTGSQIGSTVFISPASLAQYGMFSLLGWLISAFGAVALCFVFAALCGRFPETGGPHTYINHAFGRTAAFFTGWTYWVISWVSSTVVTITAVGALSPFLGDMPQTGELALQILLLILITLLNFKGVSASGKAEFVLMVIKIIPLFVIPFAALFYFNTDNFAVSTEASTMPVSDILSRVIMLTFFGFIGLECATTPAAEIKNASKTIPRAIVSGTLCVALLYMFNSIAIIGAMPAAELSNSKAPYVDVARITFGGNWYFLISLMASITCIGSLNAWIISSSQTVLGLAQDGLMPKKFAEKNKQGAPTLGIIVSCVGIVPLLILTTDKNLATQITAIIDFSVTAFLFVYLFCCFALIKLYVAEKKLTAARLIYCASSILFCLWVIYETPLKSLLVATLFVCSGIPVYWFWVRKNKS